MNLKLENPYDCVCLITVRAKGKILLSQLVDAGRELRFEEDSYEPDITVEYHAAKSKLLNKPKAKPDLRLVHSD